MHVKSLVWHARIGAVVIPPTVRSMQMMDIIMVALGVAFFAASVGYTIACDHL
jgi:hypothetical protein